MNVIRDAVHPFVKLGLGRQFAVYQEVRDLQKGGVLGQLLNRIAAVPRIPCSPSM